MQFIIRSDYMHLCRIPATQALKVMYNNNNIWYFFIYMLLTPQNMVFEANLS